jgi:hypothetical protein
MIPKSETPSVKKSKFSRDSETPKDVFKSKIGSKATRLKDLMIMTKDVSYNFFKEQDSATLKNVKSKTYFSK